MKRSFDDYFSLPAVAWQLCSTYVRKTSAPSQAQILRLSDGPACGELELQQPRKVLLHEEIRCYLPPRRSWLRPHRRRRKRMNAAMAKTVAIFDTIMMNRRRGYLHKSEWGRRLLVLAKAIELRRDNPARASDYYELRHLVCKKPRRNAATPPSIRLITEYVNFEDRILWALTNRCLRDVLNPLLHEGVHGGRGNGSSHLTAIRHLLQYARRTELVGTSLWVSQIDICGLFDSISHSVVIDLFDAVMERYSANGHRVDPRLRNIVVAYLKSYNRSMPSVSKALSAFRRRCHNDAIDMNPPLIALRQFHQDMNGVSIGIPQGGSLSPTLANLVLNYVDQLANSATTDGLFYLRYCDDILMVHHDRNRCCLAYDRVAVALREVCLLHHIPPAETLPHTFRFYSGKAKPLYKWGDPRREADAVPWVSYLGYMVRTDGFLRIRIESLTGLAQSIRSATSAIVHSMIQNFRSDGTVMCPRCTVQKVRSLAISIVVGRSHNGNLTDRPLSADTVRPHRRLKSKIRYRSCPQNGWNWFNSFPILHLDVLRFDLSRIKKMDFVLDEAVSAAKSRLASSGMLSASTGCCTHRCNYKEQKSVFALFLQRYVDNRVQEPKRELITSPDEESTVLDDELPDEKWDEPNWECSRVIS